MNLINIRLTCKLSLIALGLSYGLITTHADTLALYTFDSGSSVSTDTNVFSNAGSFTVGNALVGSSAGIDSVTQTAFAQSSITPDSATLAISAGSYFSFTLTPEAGYALNLSALIFDTVYNGSLSSGVLTANYFVRSSLDGFSTNIATPIAQLYAPSSSSSFTLREIDLSSNSSYQGIVSTIEFRIYVYDNSTSPDRIIRLDNVTLNGATPAIPEPSFFVGLVGCCSLLASIMMRHRHCNR